VIDSVAGSVTQTRFRQALGHFATGVTVVTALAGGEPVGFACQSFAALSLEPPLVLFCPGKRSRSWPLIERAGRFCVNVLTHRQSELSAVFGRPGADKFANLAWSPAPSGAPVLDGVLTWIDCEVWQVHASGDHFVVIGRVRALGDHRDERPLLFYRGSYTVTEPNPGIFDSLTTWSRPDDWI
jgi:3-hydroxy-9,10-secoandrosta-1,3,5(10)-triene-9,17-dione monooxygenase reductase component